MADWPKSIHIHEEGPREGFQFEKAPIPTASKVELIDALSETGLKEIQVVSFVNPKRVPGMADADEVVRLFRKKPGVRYSGLWLNEKGLERAIATNKIDVKGRMVLCASEPFLARNQNATLEQMVQGVRNMLGVYKQHGIAVEEGGVQAAFGCNFKGEVPVEDVLTIVHRIMSIAAEHEIQLKNLVLADTMAWATPRRIRSVVGAVRERYPDIDITLHLHDTRGMGIANAYAGLEMGVRSFDSSVAGLGGCPFAAHKGAAGNVCTEDLVFMCEEMGIDTGVDLDRLIDAANLAEKIVGHPLPGAVKQGGSLQRLREAARAAATAKA
ncbi:MAG TPA: hydroxymethylglutaryl-CoA lyase [Usitatibacter sp.]|jgi:hydroxymethylglutaryl-CoA lyase